MFDAIATVLAWFYSLVGSYGGAIMLLTLAIMVVLTPLTLKGTRSMLAMQRLQPELRKLQTKYKDDREKLNQELLAFYKENNINPVGGCLPLLIQMPVFFVLYRVLFGLTRRQPYGRDLGAAFNRELRGEGAFERFGFFDPDHLDKGTRLYEDLSNTDRMGSFGMDLAQSAQKVLTDDGMLSAAPYIVLVLIVAATSYIQQKQVSGRNTQAQSQMNQQQQMLLKIMPLFFVFISFTLPAGIVLYFVVSNLYRVGQQAFITRTMYSGDNAVIETTAREHSDADSPKGIKGFLASLAPPKEPVPETKGKRSSGGNGGAQSKARTAKSGTGKGGAPSKGAGKASGSKGGAGKGATRTAPTNGRKSAEGSSAKGSGASHRRNANRASGTPSSNEQPGADSSVAPKPPGASKGQAPSRQQRPANPRSQSKKKRK